MNLSVKPYKIVKTIPLALMLMSPAVNINAVNTQQKADTYESALSIDDTFRNATKFNSDQIGKTFTAAVLLIMGMFGVASYINSHHKKQ